MMACKEIGQVEVKQVIEWRIADFLSVAKNKNFHYYKSPTFSIENVPYFFRLRPQNRLNPEYACLYLASDVEQECTVEYNFSLKKSGNGMEKLTTRLVGDRSRCANYISLLDVHQRKAELAPRDVITITCNLNNQIIASVEQAKLDKMKSLKLISKLGFFLTYILCCCITKMKTIHKNNGTYVLYVTGQIHCANNGSDQDSLIINQI